VHSVAFEGESVSPMTKGVPSLVPGISAGLNRFKLGRLPGMAPSERDSAIILGTCLRNSSAISSINSVSLSNPAWPDPSFFQLAATLADST
jgi:hypothetical protein